MKRAISLALLLVLALPGAASADRYRPRRAGHPVRIAAYILHPIGYALDRLIFHPIWQLGQQPALAEIFGVETSEVSGSEVPVCQRTMAARGASGPACSLGDAGSTEDRIQCFLEEWKQSIASLDYERYRLLGLKLSRDHFERSYGWPACAEIDFELLHYDEPEPGQLKLLVRMVYSYQSQTAARRVGKERRIVLRETEDGLRYAGSW
jgi:hypothetical protein